MAHTLSRVTAALGILSLTVTPQSAAQLAAFRYDSTLVPVGRAYHYVKSNRDGTRPGRVSVYVAARDRLESLKWHPGGTEATLVTAEMDWATLSVRRFDVWHLARGAPDERRAWLEMNAAGKTVRTSFTGDTAVALGSLPWHSYDFDFASLALVLPHLRDPEGVVVFERADVVPRMGETTFTTLGLVRLGFVRSERHGAVAARRYAIGGPGLSNRTGLLWTDARSGWMLEFLLPVPDEPGYRDGRLRLVSTETMGPAEWTAYKRAKVGD